MIELTRINGTKIAVSPFIIEFMEETPDTIILFNSGRKMVVKEKIAVINDKIADFFAEGIRKGIEKSGLIKK